MRAVWASRTAPAVEIIDSPLVTTGSQGRIAYASPWKCPSGRDLLCSQTPVSLAGRALPCIYMSCRSTSRERRRLETEVSYLNGDIVSYGTRGSVRLDVVEGNPLSPKGICDLKTGSASPTPARIAQVQANLPKGYQDLPVLEIRP